MVSKRILRSLTGLALGMMMFGSVPLYAQTAQEARTGGEPVVSEVIETVEDYTPEDILAEKTDELFTEYIESQARANAAVNSRVKKKAGDKLTGVDKKIYDKLIDYIRKVASGEISSTVFTLNREDLGLPQVSYTASDLGVDAIVKTNSDSSLDITPEAQDAFLEKSECGYHQTRIIQALIVDNPYDLYWYDKTVGTNIGMFSAYQTGGIYKIEFSEKPVFKFAVAKEYVNDKDKYDEEGEKYKTNTTIGTSVQTVIDNANAILTKYADSTDDEKLNGYRSEICDMVSYNDKAAADQDMDYGKPWQLIGVFDGDPKTEVVCEGYAKAFQYLCDMTDFSGDIECITVTGKMDGGTGAGAHMWNIVSLGNDRKYIVDEEEITVDCKNYLVDVTNCDNGTIGADDQLFLAWKTEVDEEKGDGFQCSGGKIYYKYDNIMTQVYGEDDLTISSLVLPGQIHQHIHLRQKDTATEVLPDCIAEGYRKWVCRRCNETLEEETLPALNHDFGEEDENWERIPVKDAEIPVDLDYHQRECTRPNCPKDGTHIEKAEHRWGDIEETIDPDDPTITYRTKTCSDCELTYTERLQEVKPVQPTQPTEETKPAEPVSPAPAPSTEAPKPQTVPVTRITLTGISRNIAAGKKIKLTAAVVPANATNKGLKWSSSNTKIATVNASGLVSVKAKTGGKSVKITAQAADGSGVKAVWNIKVKKGLVKKITISGAKKTLKVGKTMKLKAVVKATAGANKTLSWTSSNKKYATITSKGVVKALKAGRGKKVTITAAATDGSNVKKKVTFKIN